VTAPQSDGVNQTESPQGRSSIIEGTTMEQYAGIDVSFESVSIWVVDSVGWIVREVRVACKPEVLIAWFGKLEVSITRIGLEAGQRCGKRIY
jgi:hypothetical protein